MPLRDSGYTDFSLWHFHKFFWHRMENGRQETFVFGSLQLFEEKCDEKEHGDVVSVTHFRNQVMREYSCIFWRFFGGCGCGETCDSCGNQELFHIFHRLIHRMWNRENAEIGCILVYINFFDPLRRNSNFFAPCVFHNGPHFDGKIRT